MPSSTILFLQRMSGMAENYRVKCMCTSVQYLIETVFFAKNMFFRIGPHAIPS